MANPSTGNIYRSRARTERPCLKLILTFCCGLLFIHQNVECASPGAMFVFGDSYVDTGNLHKTNAAWKPPYGISFPGKPSGRHSDGKVLADLIASAFKIPTPVPYNQRDSYSNQRLCFGMNFATGGSGVFDTCPGLPSMTTQINQLQRLIGNRVFSARNLEFSLLLFTVSGNDYGFYIQQQRAVEGLPSFIESLIKQLSADLVRLYNIGFRRFAVTDMEPLGCLPAFTAENSYTSCNATLNTLALYHNSLLQEAVEGIRKSRPDGTFVILDQYSDSMAIFQHGKFRKPLRPCCTGQCGVTDSAGKALYSVCAHPKSAFFWDALHPTQSGFLPAVYHTFTEILPRIMKQVWHNGTMSMTGWNHGNPVRQVGTLICMFPICFTVNFDFARIWVGTMICMFTMCFPAGSDSARVSVDS